MSSTIRNTLAIAVKELRGYFSSPTAWIVIGIFAVGFGAFYYLFLTAFVQAGMRQQFGPSANNVNNDMIRPLLQNASVLVLFLLPMATARTYAEEKRSGTIELLLTSPITDVEIILGKFLGAVGLYLGLLAVTALYIGVLFLLGKPELRPILSGYLGLLLLGSCFISLGLFISSLTKNQIVAGIATFVISLMFWIISWFSDSAGPGLGSILSYLSITQHFEDFSKGVIDTKHDVFYLSCISFALFLTLKA